MICIHSYILHPQPLDLYATSISSIYFLSLDILSIHHFSSPTTFGSIYHKRCFYIFFIDRYIAHTPFPIQTSHKYVHPTDSNPYIYFFLINAPFTHIYFMHKFDIHIYFSLTIFLSKYIFHQDTYIFEIFPYVFYL